MSSILAQLFALLADIKTAWVEARAKRIAQDTEAERKIVEDGDAIVEAIRGQATGRTGITGPIVVPNVGVVAIKTHGVSAKKPN